MFIFQRLTSMWKCVEQLSRWFVSIGINRSLCSCISRHTSMKECEWTCVHLYVYVHMYVQMCSPACVCTHVCTDVLTCVCMYTCMCRCVHLCTCVYMFMCRCAHLCVYTCMCSCAHLSVYMWRPEVNVSWCLPLSFRQGLSLNRELTFQLAWLAFKLPRSVSSWLLWGYRYRPLHPGLHWFWTCKLKLFLRMKHLLTCFYTLSTGNVCSGTQACGVDLDRTVKWLRNQELGAQLRCQVSIHNDLGSLPRTPWAVAEQACNAGTWEVEKWEWSTQLSSALQFG